MLCLKSNHFDLITIMPRFQYLFDFDIIRELLFAEVAKLADALP